MQLRLTNAVRQLRNRKFLYIHVQKTTRITIKPDILWQINKQTNIKVKIKIILSIIIIIIIIIVKLARYT